MDNSTGQEKRKREDDDPEDMTDDRPVKAMIQNIKTRWADIYEEDDDINEMHELWGVQEDDYDHEQDIMQVMMDDS